MIVLFLSLVCLLLCSEALIVTDYTILTCDRKGSIEALSAIYWVVVWFLLYTLSATIELP